jgi:hypothetical protein
VPGLVAGYNAVDGSTDTADAGGHGTGVAQVVAATCGGCRILPVRIADESGSSTQGTIAAGIRWAADHGARVINLSWGLAVGGRSTGQVERAIAGAVDRGATVTLAVMNDGSRDGLNPWASRSPDAVRVGAVDDDGRLLPSSNHGIWVDIGARGSATSTRRPCRRRRCGRPRRALGLPGCGCGQLRRGCRPAAARSAGIACSTWTAPSGGSLPWPSTGWPSRRPAAAGVVGGSGAAIECGEFCADRLDAGTVVTLCRPDARQPLTGWRGACRGSKPYCTIRIARPATAVALARKRL